MIQYLNVFFTISTLTFAAPCFCSAAGYATTMGSIRRASSSQMLDKRGMVLWSNLFHIGILGIFSAISLAC